MLETILKLIICHMIGDHVLQLDHIAHTKGTNWYHLIVHCFLYIAPFLYVFGYDYRIWVLFGTHVIVDALKARYKKINYATDQILHFMFATIYLLW